MTEIFQYVRYADMRKFEQAGWWFISGLGGSHGQWSVLMKAPMCWRDE